VFLKEERSYASSVLFFSPEKIFYFQGKKQLSQISALLFIAPVTSEIFLLLNSLLTLFWILVFLSWSS